MFHRDVTNSRISRTTSKSNATDGFAVTRASTGIIVEGVTAIGNGRNGITLEGGPLAEGPSATGTSVGSYGKNQVRDSRSAGNQHYGIAVVGGSGIVVQGNAVGDGEMGIVVSHGAQEVTIVDNEVRRAERQGIALRNAGTDATVTGNTVEAGIIGIYARDAGGTFEDNWVEGVESHGIALVGNTGDVGRQRQHDLRIGSERDRHRPHAGREARREHHRRVDGHAAAARRAAQHLPAPHRGLDPACSSS